MINNKTRFLLSFLVIAAFFGPLMAVVAVENAKRDAQFRADQATEASVKKDAEDARYQYYLGVAQQREAGKKSMADAKSQYDQLLKDQPKLIQDNQKTVTQTTTQPVVTQRVVDQPVVTSSPAPVTIKPKSSAKTRTS